MNDDKNNLIKTQYNPSHKNRQRKNRINLKIFIFIISILFILKLIKDHLFSVRKADDLKTENHKIFLSNFSNVLLPNINSNNNREEHHLTNDNFDYHLNDSRSEHHSIENHSDLNTTLLLEISNKLHKKITRIDTLVLRSNYRTFGNYAIALNNAIYSVKY